MPIVRLTIDLKVPDIVDNPPTLELMADVVSTQDGHYVIQLPFIDLGKVQKNG